MNNKRYRIKLKHSKSFTILVGNSGANYGADGAFGTKVGDFDYNGKTVSQFYTVDTTDSVRVRTSDDSQILGSSTIDVYIPETGNTYTLTFGATFYSVTSTELNDYLKNRNGSYINFGLRIP